ncbi:branched-chain amino acid aminotransferase [Flexistipes sinusarabici]|uniref:branched-chain amino acid aminotransferase n=1 Tax=Flexistipes sinusarabici TaxID=2352 RepID=UPI00235494B1|nr:branched-chain amino acid aminotransferase [Flexistipes sinusarabici]
MKIAYNLKSSNERRNNQLKPEKTLPFGQLRTDHMFLMDYNDGEWGNARIVPYSNFSISPGATVLHYAQSIFEGAKAFMHEDGEIYTFRLDKNAKRLNKSAGVLCMPEIPEDIQIKAVHALIDTDRLWFPVQQGASLYIRPFVFGTQDSLGVFPSSSYTFAVILSPSGPYYPQGFTSPIKLLITKKFHRAVPGGTGHVKASGNYAASLQAGEYAYKNGANQVLYLDHTNTYIDEAGSMNHFHITRNDNVVIPEFTDTVLRSITSESVIELQKRLQLDIVQKRIKVDDFISEIKNGGIKEAGGFGTAAVVSAVGEYLLEDGGKLTVGNGEVGEITKYIYDLYTGIQTGKYEAPEGWLQKVERNI